MKFIEFHENTKNVINFPKKKECELFKKIIFKTYPRFKKYKLPEKFKNIDLSLEECLLKRRSIRDYSQKPLSLELLSTLLRFSVGITKTGNLSFRSYPSAGARYPLEIYLFSLNVEKLPEGIYHYNLKDHSLELLKKYKLKRKLPSLFCHQNFVKDANIIFIFTAIFGRTILKYGERGYRYIFLDAGHAAQNIQLISTALGLGSCSLGGFLDYEIENILELEKNVESVIYCISIGWPK